MNFFCVNGPMQLSNYLRKSSSLVIVVDSIFMITLVTDLSDSMCRAVTARHSACPESHKWCYSTQKLQFLGLHPGKLGKSHVY